MIVAMLPKKYKQNIQFFRYVAGSKTAIGETTRACVFPASSPDTVNEFSGAAFDFKAVFDGTISDIQEKDYVALEDQTQLVIARVLKIFGTTVLELNQFERGIA